MLLQWFLRSCWKLLFFLLPEASRPFQLAFLREPKLFTAGGRGGCDRAFWSSFSMSAFLPSFLCVRRAVLRYSHITSHPLAAFVEWRSWSQPCLPLPLGTHPRVQEVRTGRWKRRPAVNLLLGQFSCLEYGGWDAGTGSAAFLRAVFLFSFLLLQSPNITALMKLESQAQ